MMISVFCSLLFHPRHPWPPPTPALTSGDRTRNWPAVSQTRLQLHLNTLQLLWCCCCCCCCPTEPRDQAHASD